eukprot:TRINITY_DN5083_c2_g1_i1.p1 TRINITY_DN5083_c2_g1~~TRINITY_DN5083_c2_g1_i1.p1  ORF type:complete len:193 (+),score=39.60 TRINITY_DN5083_c2_g1_i1:42-620(+)
MNGVRCIVPFKPENKETENMNIIQELDQQMKNMNAQIIGNFNFSCTVYTQTAQQRQQLNEFLNSNNNNNNNDNVNFAKDLHYIEWVNNYDDDDDETSEYENKKDYQIIVNENIVKVDENWITLLKKLNIYTTNRRTIEIKGDIYRYGDFNIRIGSILKDFLSGCIFEVESPICTTIGLHIFLSFSSNTNWYI